MKTILIIFILLALGNRLWAQDHVLFRDDFDDNYRKWDIKNDQSDITSIANGLYTMQYKNQYKTNYVKYFGKDIFIHQKYDFSIETSVKLISSQTSNSAYGLFFCSKDWDNCFVFEITANGYFYIYEVMNKKDIILKDFTASGAINPKGQFNKLLIQYKEGLTSYFINERLVFSHPIKNFHGGFQGFMLGANCKIAADYFEIRQQEWKIAIPDSAISPFEKELLSANINTKTTEIAPIIAPDGKTLYFSSDYDSLNVNNKKHDLFYSRLDSVGNWQKCIRMPSPINNAGDNVCISVSPDNNSLLLEGLYDVKGNYISDQGISISRFQGNRWSVPTKVIINGFYNRNEYESFAHSPDMKVLIMSVERDDTYGLKDLYVSFLQSDGTYSVPENMGADLNSYDNEGTPFLAADSKTLYFYSYYFPGYGSADIFMTKRLDDSWKKWSVPVNLGPKINSASWDTYFSVSAKGDYAYLVSSDVDQYGNIYRIKLKEEQKPDPVIIVYGKVYNSKTNMPLEAKIIYEDFSTGKEVGLASSNPLSGEYKIALPVGKSYSFRAEVKDYIPINENIDFTNSKDYDEMERNLFLSPIEIGTVVNLKNVLFVRSKALLLQESFSELNRLVQLLVNNPSMEIELAGHTDDTGDSKANIELSEQRVATVKKYLVEHGIAETRIKGKGYGGRKPLYSNDKEETRRLNRRVEFQITKM